MSRLSQVHRQVNSYDSRLFAVESNDGVIHVLREGAKPGDSDYVVEGYRGRSNPQFIFALTDTWQLGGTPVEWGLEPILNKLMAMDAWGKYARPEDRIHEMHKVRDSAEEDKQRQTSNNNRALAMDLRKDFAKASNEFVIPAGNKDTSRVFIKSS